MGEPEVGDEFSIKLTARRSDGHAGLDGQSALCRLCLGVRAGMAGHRRADLEASRFQARHERRVREGAEPGRDRGALLRARCGRDHVVGYRIERGRGGFHSRGQGEIAGPGAQSWAARRPWSGRARSFSPDLPRYSAAASFSFKISLPHGRFLAALSASVLPPCNPATPWESLRRPAAFGATSSRPGARTCCAWDIEPFYLPSIFDRELYFGWLGRAARRGVARDVRAAGGEGDSVRTRRLWLQLPAAASRSRADSRESKDLCRMQ